MKGTLLVSIFLSLLGAALAPLYIPILYGDLHPQALEAAVLLTIIYFSSITAVGMNAVLEAYFDSNSRFTISVLSQIVVISSSILSTVLFAHTLGIYSIALGYVAGTVLSLLIKVFFYIKKGTYTLKGKMDWKEIKDFYIVFFPVAVTVMIGQINLTVDNIFASQFPEGAVTYINNAKNLVHFPQAIIGVAIATLIFPMLSKAQSAKNPDLFKSGLQRGFSLLSLILLPALAGIVWLMPSIIEVIYQRGEFTEDATAATTNVAYFYIGSVLFFSLQAILSKGFYALQKGQIILRIGLLSILLNIFLNFFLTKALNSYLGIPLASSLVALIYFVISFYLFIKLTGRFNSLDLTMDLLKIVLSVIIMMTALYTLRILTPSLPSLLNTATAALVGATVYTLSILALRVSTVRFLLSFITKGRRN
ncbi:lipid II flippase MurJ [Jeotgalibacillus sp. ET6]|uniref:murein biosynthesis integral membrane protein MurJ n=1 Tax=Jeotgalibacillus sp. ET6 TaxID=3037260 RepID=UPI002418ABC4|nr:lipid II flippase MurJ [Jeotgalibacillus sp. ET6]MDG5472457.1 lipid II flippase MurJ [Jeotgalibacillus sp. ET6]